MDILKNIEDVMVEWQDGIRVLYKDLQEFHNWNEDKVWFELEAELKRICPEGDFGEDDLASIREILTFKRDVSKWEAVRLAMRFPNKTPLLDALNNLRNTNSRS